MKTRDLVFAVLGTITKVVVTILVVYYVYQGALIAYDYGYRIFAEPAMTEKGEGWEVKVTVPMGSSAKEVGELLQGKGLIRDANLFYLQNLLSEYKDEIKPGTYVLNTSMTAREMMEVMSEETQESSENTK